MIATSHEPLLLDPERYEQAMAILTRAALSPREQRLYNGLVGVTVAALTLSVAWLFILPESPLLLWAVTGMYVMLLPISMLSLPLFRKVWAIKKREREYSLSRPLKRLARRQRGYFLFIVLNGFWLLLGLFALYWALIGVSVWQQANWIGRLGVFNLLGLALSCALIVPVRRVRQKVAALASVQAAVSSAAGNGEIDDLHYDGLICLERLDIAGEREEAVTGLEDDDSLAVRMTDTFVQACDELDEPSAMAVYDTIQRLVGGVESSSERHGVEAVPGLPLSVAFTRDIERNEITFTELIQPDDRAAGSDSL